MCQWINDSGRFMRYPWIIGPMALAHFTNMRVILLLGYSKAELWGIKGVFIEIIQPNAMADSKNWICDVDNDESEIRVIKFKNLVNDEEFYTWGVIIHQNIDIIVYLRKQTNI